MAQARQHPALSLLLMAAMSLLASHAAAAPRAAACVAAHAKAVQAEQGTAEQGREAFEACALAAFGKTVAPRLQRCHDDLAEVPVILLYRAEGLSRGAAQADLQRAGQLDDGSDYARRAPVMLGFAYQGAGPAAGKAREWMDARLVDWTEQCLSGRLPGLRL
ncbi:hypothetical protein [Pelomonas sp. SE-A7]|uniref:hypothetical protein n=1 Tax=Pelomonas sp. SE-A7 TaxID=3054953 RepID=UPI00259C8E29|nr:hypothetical protein [Pelomonas sp. SE-A7]MDM4764991.1 hypothetical protein [Pelomonas sp. SE-A7]